MPVLASPLAAEDGFSGILAQLVFVLLMLAAWAFRKLVARAQRASPPPRPSSRAPAARPDAQRPDVVFGSRPLAHPPHGSRVPHREHAALSGSSHYPATTSVAREGAATSGPRAIGGGAIGGGVMGSLGTAAATRGIARYAGRGRVRLGLGRDGLSIREATRRGIIWSEVLGPPRALRGPHRPPAASRRR